MSRLYDRVVAEGCGPLKISYLWGADAFRNHLRATAAIHVREANPSASEADIPNLVDDLMARWEEPEAIETFAAGEVDDAVVVVGDEVARYYDSTRREGEHVDDRLGVVMPPFPLLWVEAQAAPNLVNAHSFGVLLEVVEDRSTFDLRGDPAVASAMRSAPYVIEATLIVEWRKGRPVGPCLTSYLGVGDDGHWLREDGKLLAAGSLPEFDFITDEEMAQLRGTEGSPRHILLGLMTPLLLTAFMHCRNVSQREVEPPAKLSARQRRKAGRPLVTYRVLDIEPLREILNREGDAQTKGLGHALHICRGHFKTSTPEAPLLGRHVGTYWWPAQVRGKAEHGVVEKDYRVRLDDGPAESFDDDLGREYVEANEHSEISPGAPEHSGLDPDLGGRGLRAHNVTQNLLARAVREAGHDPRRPKPDEPQYDLAWEDGGTTWVAEVKSVTPQNEEKQLRMALGQVLRYCQLMEEEGRTVRPMIATEVKPSDASWVELCAREGIALGWLPDNLSIP